MKKIIINENWEEEIIEDNSNFFVLIFKQGSNAGYVKAFSPNNEEILNKYQELVSQYEDTAFEVPTNILIIKVPATGQVKVMLDQALYTGEENNPEQVEILNHLLGRADCEYIGETNLETLEEAKKKKKRKKRKTPKVTYTTGWPWYNDHMFNHHMGSCDCNKDKDEAGEDAADNANDAIGGGESVGDAGSAGSDFGGGDSAGGEGGAMGESLVKESWEYFNIKDRNSDDVVTVVIVDKRFEPLFNKDHKESLRRNNVKVEGHYFNGTVVTGKVGDIIQVCDECHVMNPNKIFMEAATITEALTPLQKMYALENGTRGFNAAAASDQKLWDNLRICADNNLLKAYKIMQDELTRRGLLPVINQPTTATKNPNPYKKAYDPDIKALDFQPSDIFFIWEHKDDLDLIIESLTEGTARQTLFNLIIYLMLAVYLKEPSVIEGLKSWIINEYSMTSAELKELILKKALNNKEIHNRIIDCINTANSERKK